jgi:hypothetical protein
MALPSVSSACDRGSLATLVGYRMGDQKSTQASPCFARHVKLWSQLHLQSLGPTNPHWALVVRGRVIYDPFSLCVINS